MEVTNKTHTVLNMVRTTRKQKQLKMEAEINTMFFSAGEEDKHTRMTVKGKFSLPNAVHFDIRSPEGDFSLYANEESCYVLADEEVDELGKEEQQQLLASMQLDQITKNNFERLMIYAEDMETVTDGSITTISLPADALDSAFVREFEEDMQQKDPNIVVKKMNYAVKIDDSYNLVSFYMFSEFGFAGIETNVFKFCTETTAHYFPIGADEDFSIPQHIIDAAK